jgi:hypothetical protein
MTDFGRDTTDRDAGGSRLSTDNGASNGNDRPYSDATYEGWNANELSIDRAQRGRSIAL